MLPFLPSISYPASFLQPPPGAGHFCKDPILIPASLEKEKMPDRAIKPGVKNRAVEEQGCTAL